MIRDIFSMALDTMKSYKIRTFLTLIGVIIGVASVIMVTTAGNSVSTFIAEQWNLFNPTGMVIGMGTGGTVPQLSIRSVVFTTNDVDNIQRLPSIKTVAPIGIVPVIKILKRDGFLKWESRPGETMYASTASILEILNMELEEGTMFQEGKNEVVISKNVAETFGKDKRLKIGDTIYLRRVDGKTLDAKVVGILKQSSTLSMFNTLSTPGIICPAKPYYSSYFGSNAGSILKRVVAYTILLAEAKDTSQVQEAQNEILSFLNGTGSDASQYKDQNSDFVVITQQYILDRVDKIMSVIRTYITAIALISLLIGGVGIANIMFATVTERTREIGTMMAIGAKRRDILQLFLYQSMIIGLLGGLAGCILGASGSWFVVDLLNNSIQNLGGAFSTGSIQLSYAPEWFLIASIVGILIGIAAGVLPARKAAKMDPVVALRWE
ncbi:MAG TPA: ABC transporter permease [Candidatus Thermoplasmatota archaeon]|nr:ABC transporter permease [Candidatus Thermoplasmatota archaeon]